MGERCEALISFLDFFIGIYSLISHFVCFRRFFCCLVGRFDPNETRDTFFRSLSLSPGRVVAEAKQVPKLTFPLSRLASQANEFATFTAFAVADDDNIELLLCVRARAPNKIHKCMLDLINHFFLVSISFFSLDAWKYFCAMFSLHRTHLLIPFIDTKNCWRRHRCRLHPLSLSLWL